MEYCTVCGISIAKSYMKDHIKSGKHLSRLNPEFPLNYCPCGKSFSKLQNLYRHRKNCDVYIQNPTPRKSSKMTIPIVSGPIPSETAVTSANAVYEEIGKKIDNLESKLTPVKKKIYKRENITVQTRQYIKEKQNNVCGICEQPLSHIFQIDHTIAVQFGGTNDLDNLMALCCNCHAEKSFKELKCRNEIRTAIQGILSSYMPT